MISGASSLPALEQLKSSITCSICLDLIKDPVIVCKNVHTFCRHCITAWGKKPCPECRQPLLLQFLPHRLVAQNIEIYQKATGQAPSLATRVQPKAAPTAPSPPKAQPVTTRCLIVEAVQKGDVVAVRELIKQRANINRTDVAGRNPLFYAKTREMIELLLRGGAKVLCAPVNRAVQAQDLFLEAVAKDDLVMAKEMLENGLCDINEHGQQSHIQILPLLPTALHIATHKLLPMMTRLLIKAGAKLEVTTEVHSLGLPKQATPLLSLVTNVHIRVRLDKEQQDLNAYNTCIELLLRAGANIHAQGPGSLSFNGSAGTVAFVEAVKYCSPDIIHLFLRKGADINVADAWGCTAIYQTIRRFRGPERLARLELLMAAGANIKDPRSLALAAQFGDISIMKTLLDLGAFAYTPRMYTPLHSACRFREVEMVRFLLTYIPPRGDKPKDYINSVAGDDLTPLILACGDTNTNAIKCVELLLDHGADPNTPDRWGKTPLRVACGNNCLAIAELLIGRGADPHISDKEGNTPMGSAKQYQNSDLAALLERASLNSFLWMQ